MADENSFNAGSGVGEVTGRAYYASVTTPNTTFDDKWEVNLVLDDDTLTDFENRGHPVKEKDYGRFVNFMLIRKVAVRILDLYLLMRPEEK